MFSAETLNGHGVIFGISTFLFILAMMLASVRWARVCPKWAPLLFFNPISIGFAVVVMITPLITIGIIGIFFAFYRLGLVVSQTQGGRG